VLNFPLRPGDTNFAINYDVPYTGKIGFHPHLAYGVQQLAVMFPESMKFSSSSSSFHPIIDKNGFVVQAATQVPAGAAPSFDISGTGMLGHAAFSSQPQTVRAPQQSGLINVPTTVNQSNPQLQAANTNSGTSSPAPVSEKTSRSGSPWPQSLLEPASLLLMSVVVAIVGVTAFLWRIRKASARLPNDDTPAPLYSPLEAVKQEFMRLETARLNGAISLHQYNANKRVIERTMKRVLQKAGAEN